MHWSIVTHHWISCYANGTGCGLHQLGSAVLHGVHPSVGNALSWLAQILTAW